MQWKFEDPQNTAVITTGRILSKKTESQKYGMMLMMECGNSQMAMKFMKEML